MFKHYFETIENIERGPIISLIIFFVFFVCLLVYIWKMDKKHVDRMKNMPMDEEGPISINPKEL